MQTQYQRTAMLLGEEKIQVLQNKKVAVFGIGGVGGYVCEALARSGIGHFELFDHDVVSATNINRQIIALHSTVGRKKTEVMKERMLDINPELDVVVHDCFYLPRNADEFSFSDFDYVVDCVDTVTAKLEIISRCKRENVPVISSMGTGNKLDPTGFVVTDISKTKVCPLAKVMRKECKTRGIKDLKVVYSEEKPISPKTLQLLETEMPSDGKRSIPGSIAFVPSAAGLVLAAEVVKDLCL